MGSGGGPLVVGLGLFDGELFELVDEFAQASGVVEPGPVALCLFVGERAGDGLAGHAAGPGPVGTVAHVGVGVAVAVAVAAAAGARDQAAGQGRAERSDLVGEFTAAAVEVHRGRRVAPAPPSR